MNWVSPLLIAVAVSFVLKAALALNTYGSNDVITWERHMAKISDAGGLAWYRDGAEILGPGGRRLGVQAANHPPFVIHMLTAWDSLAHLSGLPFRFWLRITSSLADIGSLLLVWSCLTTSGSAVQPEALLLVALSPVSIMVSGFHGNTDTIMVFLLLFSIWLAETNRPAWLAGAAFGMAMNIKILPIIFASAFLLYIPSFRRRIEFIVAAAVIFIAGSLPYLAQCPTLVIRRLFGYNSTPAAWGVSQISSIFLPPGIYSVYLSVGKVIALLVILLTSIWMNRKDRKPTLFLQCGCIAFLFIFWTPGFAVQYLAWLVPWGAALSGKRILLYYASSGAFLFACYTLWSGGFPWFLANSFDQNTSVWMGMLVLSLGMVCWISVGAVACDLMTAQAASRVR